MNAILGAVAALMFVLLIAETARRRKLAARVQTLEAAVALLEGGPKSAEFRVDRYDLLWYPKVEFSEKDKTFGKIAAGIPHCKKCVLPLKLDGKEWVCSGCSQRRPESVADIMVMDSITKEATAFFLERHKDFRAR
jgi:hypothetical protein